jgi:hypothetical protein
MIDEVEEPLVGPVHVLEDEHEWALLGKPFEEAPPGGERLHSALLAHIRALPQPDHRQEVRRHPAGVVSRYRGRRLLELRARLLPGVGVEDPRLSLDHFTDRPEGDALAVREAASLTPVDEIGISLDGLE